KGGGDALDAPLRQYIYQDIEPAAGALAALTAYMRASEALLTEQDAAAIAGGKIAFAPPPGEN
ncbi:MAG: ubiquinol-cytochrome C chaperone family protein, partial [Pseudomonadota bacterium]